MANGEAGGNMVVCQNSQGTAIHAGLLHLTRYLATFEIYTPGLDLRVSERLSDVKIIVNDQVVYSGTAVVTKLVNAGAVLICEAKLDEAWYDADFSPRTDGGAELNGKFREFIQEWQKLYRVTPEYKVVLADMRTFLTDLRLWLEQVELGIRSSPSADRIELEQEIAQRLAPAIIPAINSLFERFEAASQHIELDLVPAHHVFGKRQLHPLLLCSPFVYRTYAKPLSFAGDYEVVNMMFRNSFEGGSLFAKMVNAYALQLPPIVAHRNRVAYLTERLTGEAQRVAAQNRPVRMFSLGCGPAHEVQRFMANEELSNRVIFTLADFDDETLGHAGAVVTEAKRRHGRATQVQVIKKSVQQVLKEADRTNQHPNAVRYDLIYCAGLFDYLADKVCRKLMDYFYDVLSPGGLLIATNVDAHPARNEMECFLEWHLVYRNVDRMLTLAPGGTTRDNVKLQRDATGVNIFMEVRKPNSEN
jgi:extracellular factor (EF) 3-hydroxypalmitic acid methyl ester biosynthesis protein